MKLYELVDNVTIQGNIEIRNLLCNGDIKKCLYFESMEDLRIANLEGMEDLNITYMYSETFEQKNWTYTRTRPLMVIEVEEDD
jgi:hypothetical protein